MRYSKSLTSSDKILIAKALLVKMKAEAKKDYHSYIKLTNHNYEPLKHSELLANTINEMIVNRDEMLGGTREKKNQYLMISLPP